MAWDHLSITKPHLVYIILGGFTSVFMLCSSVIKEKMYIGEATVATICGLVFGPHAANLIDPQSWGSVDIVTIEFSRIVLVVQCFAVGVELPKFYMERHWKSVVFLLVPVMTFGWLITSLFIWWMITPLTWLESLVVAACVTATDPVLASSVVGKGKFAHEKVPKHLRDLLSAESGCNDGMAFPFIYLSLYLIQDHQNAREVTLHWIVFTILYECIFGAFYGFMVGYLARQGIRFAEKHKLIDRESFLVFYFVLALFCAGSGSILGVDDLLVGFACGVGFSNDGWFSQKTEESHVSNVIDLLLNLAYFVFLGTIIPWDQFNNAALGLSAWRLTIIAIFVILFRRIPIMMALKPLIPDIKTWREALFAGHFGPIGVGAIFVAILARAELETENPVPLAEMPSPDVEHYTLIALVWPVVTFLVIASIIVHGSSVAVFTLGKHINTLAITMSYTQAQEDGPSWMNRLPRISSQSRSQARTMSDTDEFEEMKLPDLPAGTVPPSGIPSHLLRRVREEEGSSKQGSRASSIVSRRRKKKKWDDGIGPGGPIHQSAFGQAPHAGLWRRSGTGLSETTPAPDSRQDIRYLPPERQDTSATLLGDDTAHRADAADDRGKEKLDDDSTPDATVATPEQVVEQLELYDEGSHVIVENQEGDVLAVESPIGSGPSHFDDIEAAAARLRSEAASGWTYGGLKKKLWTWRDEEIKKRKDKEKNERRHEPARAYQFGNTIIVEDEDGEVVKKYELPQQDREGPDRVGQSLRYMGMGSLVRAGERTEASTEPSNADLESGGLSKMATRTGLSGWAERVRSNAGGPSSGAQRARKKSVVEQEDEEDDLHIRFTIGGVGQRMTKGDFITEMQKLEKGMRSEVVDQSDATNIVKTLAKQDRRPSAAAPELSPRGKGVATGSRDEGSKPSSIGSRRRSGSSSSSSSGGMVIPSRITMGGERETAAEKRRRLAVLRSVRGGDDDTEENETPAEKRRREAALGLSSAPKDDDSEDDDDTRRVPPARRGIRFADDVPARGRK